MDKLEKLTMFINDEIERNWIFNFRTKEVTDHMDYMSSMWKDNVSRAIRNSFSMPFRNYSSELLSYREDALKCFNKLHSVTDLIFKKHIKVHGLSEEITDKQNESAKKQKTCEYTIAEVKEIIDRISHITNNADEEYQKWSEDVSKFQYIYCNRRKIY